MGLDIEEIERIILASQTKSLNFEHQTKTLQKRNEVTLKEGINKLLDAYQLKGRLKLVELQSNWESLVGSMIAKHTLEMYMKGSTLVLRFDSAPLKQEVSMMKSRLIKHLNEALGGNLIKDILFV